MLGALCLVVIDFACDLNRLFVLAWMDDVFHPYWHNLAHRIYWVVLFRSPSSTMRRRCSAGSAAGRIVGPSMTRYFPILFFVGAVSLSACYTGPWFMWQTELESQMVL